MNGLEFAAVIIIAATLVIIMTVVMFFVCNMRGQGNRVLPTVIPPCPPKNEKEEE